MSEIVYLFKKAFNKWKEDDGITSSAALSFHAIIGFPALLLFILFLGSIFLKENILKAAIVTDLSIVAGETSLKGLNLVLQELSVADSAASGVIISFFIYLWSAGNIFLHLQKMINKMWGLKPYSKKWLNKFFHKRLSAIVAAMIFGIVVAGSTMFEIIFFIVSGGLEEILPIPSVGIQYASFAINFITLIILIMYLFRVLPDTKIGLKYVLAGSLLTVIFLTLGKYLMGFYLAYSNITTVYGTIGSLIIIFLWVYFSSIVLTFMAEFTGVYSESER